MVGRSALGFVTGLALFAVAGASGCSSSPSAASLEQGCSINSDCNPPLVCAFSRCHAQCTESRDCASGERCVASTNGGVCQLTQESSCEPGYLCQPSEVCGADQQCRPACTSAGGCVTGDYCLTEGATGACYAATNAADEGALVAAGVLSADGATISDASVISILSDGASPLGQVSEDGSGGPDGSPAAAGGDGATSYGVDATVVTVTNPCVVAETQFGNTAQGDANPGFTSGVGVRTSNALLVFSGYSGPDPSAGASDAGDAGAVNLVYVQAFDATSANSLGPAQPLFAAPAGTGFVLESASVAPTGAIALVFNYGGPYLYDNGGAQQNDLYVAFVGPAADAGPAGVALERSLLVQSGQITGQPHVIWSTALGAFVLSWEYPASSTWFVGSKNFLPLGQAAGGEDPVSTDNASSTVHNYGYNLEQGSFAVGPFWMAMAFQSDGNLTPSLSILGLNGDPIGSPLSLASINNSVGWETVGATAAGFVFLYSNGNAVSEVFVPTLGGDAGAAVPDAGDAGLAGFTFPGLGALDGHAISDDTGGAGGVGVALLYSTGLNFAYVNADGTTHVGPSPVIANSFSAGDQFNIANFGGSFSLSLYSAAKQSTQVAASGCQ